MKLEKLEEFFEDCVGLVKRYKKGLKGRKVTKYTEYAQKQLINHCGACSVSNAVRRFDIVVSQEDVAAMADGTVSIWFEGIDEVQIKRALKKLGLKGKDVQESRFKDFAKKLKEHLLAGNSATICTWDDTHWMSVVDYRNGKFVVSDSYDYEHEVSYMSEKRLREEMKGDSTYSGVFISRKSR